MAALFGLYNWADAVGIPSLPAAITVDVAAEGAFLIALARNARTEAPMYELEIAEDGVDLRKVQQNKSFRAGKTVPIGAVLCPPCPVLVPVAHLLFTDSFFPSAARRGALDRCNSRHKDGVLGMRTFRCTSAARVLRITLR